jgi:hypothetical protein
VGKHFSEKQRNLPPSQRTYSKHMKVPEGCVDVWRINVVDTSGNVSIYAQYRERDVCMRVADSVFLTRVFKTRAVGGNLKRIFNPGNSPLYHIYVEHKAAIQIGEKFHIVNIPSFRFSVVPEEATDPDPDHKQWLAEFEGMPLASDHGEAIHNEINYKRADE